MDILTLQELKDLFVRDAGWCVSLYMPTHWRGPETEQDPIRFRNLLRQAKERLLAKGLRSPDADEMLEPAEGLSVAPGFWRHQSDGLAVFLTSEEFQRYRLPLPFEELVVISERFHLKPLLPFFASDGHFYILALSQNEVRLLEGTRHTVDEVDVESMPESLAQALQYEHFEKQLQFHTGTTSAGGGARSAMYHGSALGDEDKGRILRWFHKIDDELPNVLTGGKSPLVLAGVEYLFPLYEKASSYPHLLKEGIAGNPEELTPQQLHAEAWPLVQPTFLEAREEAAAQYSQLADTERASADVQETVLAAHHGRVDFLFVALGVQVWGSFDQPSDTVHLHEEPEPGDDDLLDLAAIQTLLKGGTVYAVEREQVPNQALLAAVFRY